MFGQICYYSKKKIRFALEKKFMGKRPEIIERNNKLLAEYNNGRGATLHELSAKYNFEVPYLRSILKEAGVVFTRKERYSRSDQDALAKRDESMVVAFMAGVDVNEIASTHDITKTRVLQILKEQGAFAPREKQYIEIQQLADKIRTDIRNNLPYESVYKKEKYCTNTHCVKHGLMVPQSVYKCQTCKRKLSGKNNTLVLTGILDKYGKDAILKCKRLKINIFRETFDHRINGVLSALDGDSIQKLKDQIEVEQSNVDATKDKGKKPDESRLIELQNDLAGRSPLHLAARFHCTRDYIYHIKKEYGK